MNITWRTLITVEQVLALHAKGIAAHSQETLEISSSSGNCVEGRIGNAWNAEVYSNTGEDAVMGLSFAGYLLYYLVRDHCFPDGNKRVGWATSMAVLACIGLTVNASTDESQDFVERIARGSVGSGAEVVNWISSRLEAPDDPVFPESSQTNLPRRQVLF